MWTKQEYQTQNYQFYSASVSRNSNFLFVFVYKLIELWGWNVCLKNCIKQQRGNNAVRNTSTITAGTHTEQDDVTKPYTYFTNMKQISVKSFWKVYCVCVCVLPWLPFPFAQTSAYKENFCTKEKMKFMPRHFTYLKFHVYSVVTIWGNSNVTKCRTNTLYISLKIWNSNQLGM